MLQTGNSWLDFSIVLHLAYDFLYLQVSTRSVFSMQSVSRCHIVKLDRNLHGVIIETIDYYQTPSTNLVIYKMLFYFLFRKVNFTLFITNTPTAGSQCSMFYLQKVNFSFYGGGGRMQAPFSDFSGSAPVLSLSFRFESSFFQRVSSLRIHKRATAVLSAL